MGRYYDDRDDAAGCLTSLLFGAIIVEVFVRFAAIALYYIFICIVVVSAAIGTIISLKNYIVALKNSILMHRYDAVPLNWKFPNFTYKWKKIVCNSIKGYWKSNVYTLRTSFKQGLYFRFFSIRRWFYWFVCVSIALFGLAISCGIICLHLVLLVVLLAIALVIIVSIAVVTMAIALFDSIKTLVCSLILILRAQRKASCSTNLSDYIKLWGYKGIKKMPRLLWRSANKSFVASIASFRNSKILSFNKWFALGRILFIYPITILLIPFIFVIEIIVQSILYLWFFFVK